MLTPGEGTEEANETLAHPDPARLDELDESPAHPLVDRLRRRTEPDFQTRLELRVRRHDIVAVLDQAEQPQPRKRGGDANTVGAEADRKIHVLLARDEGCGVARGEEELLDLGVQRRRHAPREIGVVHVFELSVGQTLPVRRAGEIVHHGGGLAAGKAHQPVPVDLCARELRQLARGTTRKTDRARDELGESRGAERSRARAHEHERGAMLRDRQPRDRAYEGVCGLRRPAVHVMAEQHRRYDRLGGAANVGEQVAFERDQQVGGKRVGQDNRPA